MRRVTLIFVLALLMGMVSSCGLTYETLSLQVMKPAISGVDVRDKSLSAFMLYRNPDDSSAYGAVMTKVIERLAEDYTKEISLYALEYVPGSDYSSRDTLAAYLTLANTDVVLLAVPDGTNGDNGTYGFSLEEYDGTSAEDNVYTLSSLSANAIAPSATAKQIVTYFGPYWQTGNYNVLFFDGRDDWLNALSLAESGSWTAAIDKWIEILSKSNDINHRMAAEYNIALGCYLLGNYDLAKKWLTQAEADCLGKTSSSISSLKSKMQ